MAKRKTNEEAKRDKIGPSRNQDQETKAMKQQKSTNQHNSLTSIEE